MLLIVHNYRDTIAIVTILLLSIAIVIVALSLSTRLHVNVYIISLAILPACVSLSWFKIFCNFSPAISVL